MDFLNTEHIAHVCLLEYGYCQDQDKCEPIPYPFSCFYAFDLDAKVLIFKSNPISFHMKLIREGGALAGILVARNTRILYDIEGIQAKARIVRATSKQEFFYYQRYGFARFMHGSVWGLEILWCKYTNNALSKKIQFFRESNYPQVF